MHGLCDPHGVELLALDSDDDSVLTQDDGLYPASAHEVAMNIVETNFVFSEFSYWQVSPLRCMKQQQLWLDSTSLTLLMRVFVLFNIYVDPQLLRVRHEAAVEHRARTGAGPGSELIPARLALTHPAATGSLWTTGEPIRLKRG